VKTPFLLYKNGWNLSFQVITLSENSNHIFKPTIKILKKKNLKSNKDKNADLIERQNLTAEERLDHFSIRL
jgi:hypothetical protein